MRKLLSANFFSMIHAKRFWLGCIYMIAAPIMDVISLRRTMDYMVNDPSLDKNLLNCVPWLFILLPCLCGLFINTDYHDGTIRNKLTVGCSRSSVYISNLITLYIAALFYLALAEISVLIAGAGIPILDPSAVVGKLLLLLLLFLALTAIAVLIATMVTNRSALVVCALIGLGLMFGGQMVISILSNQPEIPDYQGVTFFVNEDGGQVMKYQDKNGNPVDREDIPMIPNPSYVPEPASSVLRTFNQISPGGQLWEILWDGHQEFDSDGNPMIVNPPAWQLAVYSLGVAAGFTLLGLALFGKKDLK